MEIVNTINLWKREDRLLAISKQAKDQRFALYFWEGIEETIVHTGVSKAHKQIIKDAKENGLSYVIVCEDDIEFVDLGAFDYYIKNMPKSFDLYMGMIYAGEIKDNRIMNGFSGLTLYTVHNRFYDFFLSADETDHIDRWLGNFCYNHEYFVCDKFVCKQSSGYSDRRREKCNYDVYHESMIFYKA